MHYQLGVALRKLGQAEEATTHLAEARRLGAPAREGTGSSDSSGSEAPEPGPRRMRLSFEGSPLAELPPPARTELRRRAVEGLARAYLNLGVLQAQSPTPVQVARALRQGGCALRERGRGRPRLPERAVVAGRRLLQRSTVRAGHSPPRARARRLAERSRPPAHARDVPAQHRSVGQGRRPAPRRPGARDGRFAPVRLRARPRSGRPRRRGRERAGGAASRSRASRRSFWASSARPTPSRARMAWPSRRWRRPPGSIRTTRPCVKSSDAPTGRWARPRSPSGSSRPRAGSRTSARKAPRESRVPQPGRRPAAGHGRPGPDGARRRSPLPQAPTPRRSRP